METFKVFSRGELPFNLVETKNRTVTLEDETGSRVEVDAAIVPQLYHEKIRRFFSPGSETKVTAALLDNMVPTMAHGILDYIDNEIVSLEQCIEPSNLIMIHYVGALIPHRGAIVFEGNIISKDGSEAVKTRLCAWKARNQILALVAILEPVPLPSYPQNECTEFFFERDIKVMGGRATKSVGGLTFSSVMRAYGYQRFINGVFVGVGR